MFKNQQLGYLLVNLGACLAATIMSILFIHAAL